MRRMKHPIATATLTNRRLISRLKGVRPHRRGPASDLSDDAFTAGLAAQEAPVVRGLFTADGVRSAMTPSNRDESFGFLQDCGFILLGFGVQAKHVDQSFDSQAKAEPSPQRRPRRSAGGGSLVRPSQGCLFAARDRRRRSNRRHGLRIDPGSLRSFGKHIALLPGRKLEQLAARSALCHSPRTRSWRWATSIASPRSRPSAAQQVFDLTEPRHQLFVANGITVHNCSEYMFLDDTACNLASLNVLKFFDAETRRSISRLTSTPSGSGRSCWKSAC